MSSSSDSYRMTIGAMTVTIIADLQTPPDRPATVESLSGMFPNASVTEIEAVLRDFGTQHGRLGGSLNPYVIETGGQRILVDGGMGEPVEASGYLLQRMVAAGLAPETIDTVVLSHAHGDHYRGLTTEAGGLVFPQARLVVWQAEWAYWTDAAALATMDAQRVAGLRARLHPLGQMPMELVDTEREIAPGVTLLPLPGHSPGHCGLLLESQGERALALIDAIHTTPQFQYLHWHFKWDHDPAQAIATRRAVLQQAVDENLLVLAFHLPFPGVGRVVTAGAGFVWQPRTD